MSGQRRTDRGLSDSRKNKTPSRGRPWTAPVNRKPSGLAQKRNSLPRISIVVPCLNQGAYIPQALDSILGQEYPSAEILVMDGGSSDETVAVLEQMYGRQLSFWRSRPDGGQTAAIHEGFERSTGDLVAWLNADDYYINDSLWIVANAYQKHPGCGLYVGNGLRLIQDEGKLVPFSPRHVAIDSHYLVEGVDYLLQPSGFFSRKVVEDVGGLLPHLNFGMDWDIFMRVVESCEVVAIQEYLAVSREHPGTKTAQGGIRRAVELIELTRHRSGKELTVGAAFYLLESLWKSELGAPNRLGPPLLHGLGLLWKELGDSLRSPDPYPVFTEPKHKIFLPLAGPSAVNRRRLLRSGSKLPKFSMVVPSLNQGPFLGRCLESLILQGYPDLEVLVVDGGSTDESIEVIRKFDHHISWWRSRPDSGPASAINEGFSKANGDWVGWLSADDMLAHDALWAVARTIRLYPDAKVVVGNALYVNRVDQMVLVDYGNQITGLYHGAPVPRDKIPFYWEHPHPIPQPATFFRRDILQETGGLDASYSYAFDFEFYSRLSERWPLTKINRTLAFYRLHENAKSASSHEFYEEQYRYSRSKWPNPWTGEYRAILRSFLRAYLGRGGWRPRSAEFYLEATLVAALATLGLGNIETRLARHRSKRGLTPLAPIVLSPWKEELRREAPEIGRRDVKFLTAFCGIAWPLFPPASGGEARDLFLLRRLLEFSSIDFVGLARSPHSERRDPLGPHVSSKSGPDEVFAVNPHAIRPWALKPPLRTRLLAKLRSVSIPVWGPRYHAEVSTFSARANAFGVFPLEEVLRNQVPDFLVISSQLNPIALEIAPVPSSTCVILFQHDVESERIERIARSETGFRRVAMSLEAGRARVFEADSLARMDGVIAVTDRDAATLVGQFGVEPERILVLGNGADIGYFDFRRRRRGTRPRVVFVGSLAYRPNEQAAHRLLGRIMPIVWHHLPDCECWIVGQGASRKLQARGRHSRCRVTGWVGDVRPILEEASVACVPLVSGSGTKLKVLEAMSSGLPLVTTSVGAEGIDIEDGEHALIRETDVEIADGIVLLIADAELAGNLASSARSLVEARYSWESILDPLEAWLQRVKLLPRSRYGGSKNPPPS